MSRPDRWLLCDPYCAQFKCYHDEMKENENEEPSVTVAELARVLELDAKATQGPMHVGYDGPSRPIIISANMDEPMLSIGALSHGHSEPYEKEDADCELFAEYRTLTPRLARELAAAKARIEQAEASAMHNLKERAKLALQVTDHIPAADQIGALEGKVFKLERELAAARAAIKVKDAALAHVVNDGKGREVFPPSNEWHGESFNLVEAALNTHTHE